MCASINSRSSSSSSGSSDAPPLFGRERRLLAWQGLSLWHPAGWFLRSFGGRHDKGSLRLFDEDGLRLEILWEKPRAPTDVAVSIQKLLETLAKDAKKAKKPFRIADHPDLLSRKHKEREQATTFGWSGHASDPLATQGWGASWQCAHCERVIVAHLIGRSHEGTRDTQKLASEILSGLSCHGSGGWEVWSLSGLKLEVPEEFELKNARLLAGRIEWEWERVGPQLPLTPAWTRFDERIALARTSVANIVLQNEELQDYIARTLTTPDKKRAWSRGEQAQLNGRPGWIFRGQPREMRKRGLFLLQKRYARHKPPQIELRAWHDEPSNKIFALTTELRANNAQAGADILDSIEQQVEAGEVEPS